MTAPAAQPAHAARDTVAVVFAIVSIGVAAVGLAYLPGILTPAAAALALAAVIAADRRRQFAAAAVAFAGIAWFVAMTIAVLTEHALY